MELIDQEKSWTLPMVWLKFDLLKIGISIDSPPEFLISNNQGLQFDHTYSTN